MEVTTFLLSDHAEAANGKLHMTGGAWNRLTVSNLPAQHPHMTLAIVLLVPWTATNEKHGLNIRLLDEDGAEVGVRFETQFEMGRPPGMRIGDDQTVVLAVSLNNVEFPRAGRYAFNLEIDGSVEARAPLTVLKAEAPPSTAT